MNCEDQFLGQEIDYATFVEKLDSKDTIIGQEVVQLKTNKIPKGLVVLETIFDSHDRFKVENKEYNAKNPKEVNLGTNEAPKKVYIGRKLTPKIR